MTTYVVAYDIEDDRVRAKLAKLCEKKGYRLQKSVFVVRLKQHGLKPFLLQIQNIVRDSGKVAVFRLCAGCRDSALQMGDKRPAYYVF